MYLCVQMQILPTLLITDPNENTFYIPQEL